MSFRAAVPALPVRDSAAAAAFYRDRLGFTVRHEDDGFAIVVRGEVEIHLWQASDTGWAARADLVDRPVRSGAESFLAGTASCRLYLDDGVGRGIQEVYRELSAAGVLHPVDTGEPVDTEWGTTEFPVLDLDGNLITVVQRRAE